MNDKPRLLHMTTVPQTLNFLARQIGRARVEGFDVHAVSAPEVDLQEFAARTGIDVHEIPMARRITPFKDLLALWRLRRILHRVRPSIVHGHTPKGGLLAMIGAWWCGIPVRVYHIHGLPMVTAAGLRRLLLRWSDKVSCKLATQVLCVSESVRAIAVAEGLCRADKIKVLLNGTIGGIDAERAFNPACVAPQARQEIRNTYSIPADSLVAGFVGRIVPDKGMIELALAWQTICLDFPNLHLLMIGPFEAHDPLPPKVESMLRGNARIHLAGRVAEGDVPLFYHAMDLLVLPSYREGFGMVILEAGAMELPVVATRIPGCVDGVIEGETGALVPPYDAAALADALRAYCGDAGLRRRHGQAGRARVLRDFRSDDMSEAICDEYARLLGHLREREERMNHSKAFYRMHGKRILNILRLTGCLSSTVAYRK